MRRKEDRSLILELLWRDSLRNQRGETMPIANFEDFDAADRERYTGAQAWPDGAQPRIAKTEHAEIVLDWHGCQVFLPDGDEWFFPAADPNRTKEAGQLAHREVLAAGIDLRHLRVQLDWYGFRQEPGAA